MALFSQDNGNRLVWLFLALVTVSVYFFALGSIPLLGPDEPRYAQVAREMFERNDWITPTLGGFHWFEKPALLYWLQIVSYNLFGVSEFAARFGSAVFGLLTIFSLWLIGRVSDSERAQRTEELNANAGEQKTPGEFANRLFLISASSIGLLVFSRGASFDIILTFPVTAALVSFFIFDRTDKNASLIRYLSLASFYFFIGLALLAKGLIGIVFPPAIAFFYYLLRRRLPDKAFLLGLFWGTILSFAVAAPWYVPMYRQHGWTFIDEFFIQHHFARYTSNKYLHPQPFYYFFGVLPLMTLPWLPFFLLSIWNFFKRLFQGGKEERLGESGMANHELRIFALAWLVVPLGFFSFSGSKLPGYILPALPAALILTAQEVSRSVRNRRRLAGILQISALIVFTGAALALYFAAPFYAHRETVKYLIESANAQGYSEAKILNLHTVSHNAEFYGAGRLVRNPDGKIRYFYGITEVVEEIRRGGGKTVLVLVPPRYSHQLYESDLVKAVMIGENGEYMLLAVDLK